VLRLPSQDNASTGTAAPGDGRIAEVPLTGRITAGTPVIADQLAELAEDVIPVPRMLTGEGNLIALRVTQLDRRSPTITAVDLGMPTRQR
jgi:repressor LexA